MAEKKKIESKLPVLLIILISLSYFAIFFINPKILTRKDNDLGRNYLPQASFIQKSVLENHQIPLWRPDQMMGETFIANPLSSIFYPANILFLSKNIDLAMIVYLFTHIIFSAIGAYSLARSFNLNKLSSFSAAIFYAFSIKILLHISAGHITMAAAASYLPILLLSAKKIFETKSFNWLFTGSISLTFMFFTYPTIFYYSLIFIAVYWIQKCLTFKSNFKNFLKINLLFFLMVAVTLCLSSIVLLPQLEFSSLSTRSTLKLEDVAIPLWNFEKFLSNLFFPYINLDNVDQESILYMGLSPSILALVGFFYLSKLQKIILILFGTLSLIFVVGLSTPFFELCYRYVPLLQYSRVTTRMWFTVILIVSLLAAIAINRIKNKQIIYLFLIFFIAETFYISYRNTFKLPNLNFGNEILYQTIAQDRDLFRVYCTTYCLNPQLSEKYNIQLFNGETPIQHQDFVNYLQEAGNYHYENFAVIFPPYQIWQVEKPPVPNADLLGDANVKYVLSTYQLLEPDFQYINKFERINLYKNLKYKPRINFQDSSGATISNYTPNQIKIEFEGSPNPRNLIISENYYPDWIAYVDHQKYSVEKHAQIFRKITVPPNTTNLDLKYQPETFAIGKTITLATSVVLLLYYFHKRRSK